MARPEIKRARRLRREMTGAETKLWAALRDNRFANRRFRRQHPIGPYTADFACLSAGVVIEVDGGQHGTDAGMAIDAKRTAYLASEGFRVFRVWNFQVLSDLPGVLAMIDDWMMHIGVPVRETPIRR